MTRKWIAVVVLLCLCSAALARDEMVMFGTHVAGTGKGFSLARFDPATGILSQPAFLAEVAAPAYYVFTADQKRLYTCNSGATFHGAPGGGISAFNVNPETLALTPINARTSIGGDPSYICLDKTEHYAMVANYGGGSIIVYAINADGSLGAQTAFVQHKGAGPVAARQAAPHPHSIQTDKTNRFALVPDLGQDKVFVYKFDAANGTLTPNDPPFASTDPGTGPRHLAFSPDQKFAYVSDEVGSDVSVFAWDSDKGMLSPIQTISTLPAGFKGTNTVAEVKMTGDAKHLYVTNRGNDSIARFSIDTGTGKLSLIDQTPSQGKTPRNMEIDPSGKWMIVTNHDSNNAIIFGIDPADAKLTLVGSPITVPYPFCPRFVLPNP